MLPSQFLPFVPRSRARATSTRPFPSASALHAHLEHLRALLHLDTDEVRAFQPSRASLSPRRAALQRRKHRQHPQRDGVDSGYASEVELDQQQPAEPLPFLDEFERKYSRDWTLRVLAALESEESDGERADEDGEGNGTASTSYDDVIDDASRLLADLTRIKDGGAIVRDLAFECAGQNGKVSITLHDEPYLTDGHDDHTAVGVQSWGASIVLGRMLARSPESFGLSTAAAQPLRVLELGAGTGLLGMLIAKLCPAATVVATDYHPRVLENLNRNVELNFAAGSRAPMVERLDWADVARGDHAAADAFARPFDLVFAADVLYAAEHARLLQAVVHQYLLRQSADAVFHMLGPVRRTQEHLVAVAEVDRVFPDSSNVLSSASERTLVVKKREWIAKTRGTGREDESGYWHWTIGWQQ